MMFSPNLPVSIVSATILALCSASPLDASNHDKSCYYLPSDPQWPSAHEWARLNGTVNGKLLAAIPVAETCYNSNFQSSECAHLQERWEYPDPHELDPFSIMMPYWLNDTCSPYPGVSSSCKLGNLVSYTINVSSIADVRAGLKFAKEKNIRLVLKNTGHDYLGRSTGQGALGLWTHNLKDITFTDYKSPSYHGSAVRMQAGVQGFEISSAAAKRSLRIVAGFCPTVGIAGGYTQGGGHSPLASTYGLAADNTLEFEVITTSGEHVIANREKNSDLYWALSGGGAGTYGIVLSTTVKTFKDTPVAGAVLSMDNTHTPAFWDIVTSWQTLVLHLNTLPGFMSAFTVTSTSFGINFITWPEHTSIDIRAAISPFLSDLSRHNFKYNLTTSDSPNYYSHYTKYTPEIPFGTYTISQILGGRLIPRHTVETNLPALTSAIKNITASGQFQYTGLSLNVSAPVSDPSSKSNAVLPAWRNALFSAYTQAHWDPRGDISQVREFQRETNEVVIEQLKKLTPGSGTYMNEGTFDDVDWKEDYFGANYERLREVKRKWDPVGMLYGRPNVGWDDWTVQGDGRLCRVR